MPTLANVVHQVTNSTGTGVIALSPVNGRKQFVQAWGVGGSALFWYYILHRGSSQWELGVGHMDNPTTLVRDAVLENSLGDLSFIDFTPGTKDVTSDLPSAEILHGENCITTFELADNAVETPNVLNKAITLAKMADLPPDSLIGRDTGVGSPVVIIPDPATLEFTGADVLRRGPITSDVSVPAGSGVATIQPNVVSNTKLADMVELTLKGRAEGAGTGDPTDLTGAQASAIIKNLFRNSLILASTPVTLTAADSGREIINFNANRTVNLPAPADGLKYAFYTLDGGSGGQLTVATTGGNIIFADNTVGSVVMPSNTRMILYCDSSNWIAFAADMRSDISTIRLVDDAVTFAKMQNIATDRLLGRDTAASGNIEEIALNSTLEFDGSLNLRRAALSGAAVASAGSNVTTAVHQVVVIIGDGVNIITTGVKGYLPLTFPGTFTEWHLVADVSGSIVIDVWKDTYANYPPTVADTIAGSEKPTLSSVIKNQDLSLGTWTTGFSAGDVLGFNVDSVATVKQVTLILKFTKTG